MYNYSDSKSDSYTQQSPLLTSQNTERRQNATGDMQDIQTQGQYAALNVPRSSTSFRRLSPLMVDTSFEPNLRPSSSVHIRSGSDPGGEHCSPYKLPEYHPPKSPGIFVPLQDCDERKLKQISNVIAQVLSKDDTLSRGMTPFPLMDPPPPKARYKRQISTDSSDSGDIKSSAKSPIKRMQSLQQATNRETCNTENEIARTNTDAEETSDKLYASNVKWMLEDPNPKTEEDFIPVSKVHPDTGNIQPNIQDEMDRYNAFLKRENSQRNHEVADGFRTRPNEMYTPTQSSKKSVNEQGFIFPERSNVTDPIPFSPRIVTERPRFNKVSQMNDPDNNTLYGSDLHQNFDRHSSMTNLSNGNTQSRSSSVHSNGKADNMIYQLVRRKALRSNSDIDKSPSKAEIEEMKELVRKLHRSISDPTTFSPEKKALLREERMVNEFRSKDDVFEESYSESLEQKYKCCSPVEHPETNPNKELRLMNIMIREQYEMLKQNYAKRQLFQESVEQQEREEDYRSMSAATRMDNPEDAAAKLLEELQKLSAERSMQQKLEIEGVKNRLSERHAPSLGQLSHLRREPRCSPDKSYYPSHSPRPSTSTALSPRPAVSTIPQSPSWSQGGSRKRKRGDIEMHVTCEDLAEKTTQLTDTLRHLEHMPGKSCKCANVENEILQMAVDAYSKIRRADDSRKSFEQFQEEISETNNTIFDAMKILCTIKSICKHGRTIQDIFPGSVVFRINCPTLFALDDLWSKYKSGDIEDLINETFLTEALKDHFQAPCLKLTVEITQRHYNVARHELAPDGTESIATLDSSFSKSDTEIASVGSSSKENKSVPCKSHSLNNLAIIHMHSHSDSIAIVSPQMYSSPWLLSPRSPVNTERKHSFSRANAEHSPRRAMQELNIGKDVACSPTLKKVFDFDIALSAKTSPKRKTFAESPPWEHENIHPAEVASPKRKNFGTTSFWNDNISNINQNSKLSRTFGQEKK